MYVVVLVADVSPGRYPDCTVRPDSVGAEVDGDDVGIDVGWREGVLDGIRVGAVQ